MFLCVCKRSADDALTLGTRDDLRRMESVLVDFLLNADVEIFCILAEGHDVDMRKRRLDRRIALCRTNVGKKVVLRAERDID